MTWLEKTVLWVTAILVLVTLFTSFYIFLGIEQGMMVNSDNISYINKSLPDPDIKTNTNQINFVKRQLKKLAQDSNDLGEKVTELEAIIPIMYDRLGVVEKRSLANEVKITQLFKDANGVQKQIGILTEHSSGLQTIACRLEDEVGELSLQSGKLIGWIDSFPIGKTILSEKGEKQLAELVQKLKVGNYEVYSIIGFADDSSSPNNLQYGRGRALTVQYQLQMDNIPIACKAIYGGTTDRFGTPEMDRCVRIFARRIQPKMISTTIPFPVSPVSANSPQILPFTDDAEQQVSSNNSRESNSASRGIKRRTEKMRGF